MKGLGLGLVIFILFFARGVDAIEPITIVGGGSQLNQQRLDFGFAETRLMLGSGSYRVGPYLGFVQYGQPESPAYLLGKNYLVGLSFDHWFESYSRANYFWLNSSFLFNKDFFQESKYKQETNSQILAFSGGFMSTDTWLSWFGNHRFFYEYQVPIKSQTKASWQGQIQTVSSVYNKESLRLYYENGVKRWGKIVQFEPIIHLGVRSQNGFASGYTFGEAGIGFDVGFMKEWYRDLIKVKVYQNFNQEKTFVSGEVTLNLTSAFHAVWNK